MTDINELQSLVRSVWPDWELTEELGQGSFGVVYKARRQDIAGESFCAVKISRIPRSQSEVEALRSEGMTEEEACTYFEQIVRDLSHEIRLMEAVKGNNGIVYIEDYKVRRIPDRLVWYILIRMELLTPLTRHIAAHPMSEEDIIRLGKDLLKALCACADRQIIHRDIKPENIFISSAGAFKLGDFGVARRLDNTTLAFTRAGALNYMAPELYLQTGESMSFAEAAKVDQYSLGLVMYYLANGLRLPFLPADKQILSPDDRQNAFLRRIHGDALPAPCGNVSEELKAVILKACAYRPEDRYASAEEMLGALEATEKKGPEEPPPGKPHLLRWCVVVFAVLALAGLIGFLINRNKKSGPVTATKTPTSSDTVIMSTPGNAGRTATPAPTVTSEQLISEPVYTSVAEQYDLQTGLSFVETQASPTSLGLSATPSKTPMTTSTNTTEFGIRVSDHLCFGHYEQDNSPTNGSEPIEWIVLNVQGNTALLISRYILDEKPYCIPYTEYANSVKWADSYLRHWLNNDFLNSAFTNQEIDAILLTNVDNSAAQNYQGGAGGNNNFGPDTVDRAFVLSYAELVHYLSDSRADFTMYSGNNREDGYYYIRTNESMIDPVCGIANSQYTSMRGTPGDAFGVRPALWINLETAFASAVRPTQTVAPTPTPTSIPLTIRQIEKKKDVETCCLLVSWIGEPGSYEVSCVPFLNQQQIGESRIPKLYRYFKDEPLDGETAAYSAEISRITPGRTYLISITEAGGKTISQLYTVPERQDDSVRVSDVFLTPKKWIGPWSGTGEELLSFSADELKNWGENNTYYGFRLQMTIYGRVYEYGFSMSIILPNGDEACENIGFHHFMTEETRYSNQFAAFWATINKYYNEIPTGTYKVCFLIDGDLVATASFDVV